MRYKGARKLMGFGHCKREGAKEIDREREREREGEKERETERERDI